MGRTQQAPRHEAGRRGAPRDWRAGGDNRRPAEAPRTGPGVSAPDESMRIDGAGQECQHRSGTFKEQTGTMPPDPRRKFPPMNNGLTELTDATFDEEVNSSDQPILVDFWAEWC